MKNMVVVKSWLLLMAVFMIQYACSPKVATQTAPIVEEKDFVQSLMSKMTLEDKVGEMTQLSIDVLCVGEPYNLKKPDTFDEEKLKKVLVDLKVGSILNVGGQAYTREKWKSVITRIQDIATKEKSSGIPVLYGIDAIHGTNYTSGATLFPQQLGQASTWNLDLAEQCGEVTAYETRASGIPWSFSPVLDIGRDPRWPRLWETYGEDVLLASEMGKAFIQGMQGDDISDKYKIASCMKHFLGYSVTLRGKDRTHAWIPERQLREYFLPTFKTAIDNGSMTVMINSGDFNGIPVHTNKWVLTDLLRDELGFKGLALTDWEDIGYLVSRHKVATDFKDAIVQAINAGIDLAMVPMDTSFPVLLKEAVEEGLVPMSRIDESVERILRVKEQLGLFENPYYDFDEYDDFASESHRQMALTAAEESIILAKNNNDLLPLSDDKKILVVGPNAHSLNVLNGGWTGTWQGDDPKYNTPGKMTIQEAMVKQYGDKVTLAEEGKEEAAAQSADVIMICLGEQPYTEKPGDINDLDLDAEQVALFKKLAATGKPILLLLIEGRPRVINMIEEEADAILVGFLPGDEGAEALTNIISGKTNPSGKMPITYPRYSNDLITYDHLGTDQIHTDFSLNSFNPQFEFGHGLSYTTFEYSNLIPEAFADGGIGATITVTNTGSRAGKEVVQVYIKDHVASVTPPVKKLRAFEKVSLESGETKTLSFKISRDDLKFVGRNNEWIYEKGKFGISVGGHYTEVMFSDN